MDSITQSALGINGTALTGTDTSNSDTALTAINSAIDTLNTSRATIGAAQNRLGFASANLASTIENQEASRSTLMDLDVASEMSNFTSKQVLMQAGVSTELHSYPGTFHGSSLIPVAEVSRREAAETRVALRRGLGIESPSATE